MSKKKKGATKLVPSRRDFLKGSAVVGAGAVTVGLGACGDDGGGGTPPECTSTGTGTGVGGGGGGGPDDRPTVYPHQDDSEVRWGFLIDLHRCKGCLACAVACKTEFDVRLGVFRNGVISHEKGTLPATKRHFLPWLCNHCKTPPCMDDCPVEPVLASLTFPGGETAEYWARATYQRPDGLVLVDQARCVGCGRCVTDCQYQARFLDPVKPAGGDPASVGLDIAEPKATDKCSMCVHRLEEGIVPACVNTCPANARLIGNLNDPNSEIRQRLDAAGTDAEVLLPLADTEPQVYYVGLDPDTFAEGEEPRREANQQNNVPEL